MERFDKKITPPLESVDEIIACIDQKLSKQLDEILHHPDFQKLESAWRGLKFLVDRTDFSENIKIELLNISKEDLFEDFQGSPETHHSGLYQKVYTDEYAQPCGEPYGAIIANYEFGFGPKDIFLLQNISTVAAIAHVPFIASASPDMFGIKDFRELLRFNRISSIYEGPHYIPWQSFRESEDSRYVALTLPRFLLRPPYGPNNQPVKLFDYQEDVSAGDNCYLWGNIAFTFASRLTDSFANYRHCANIVGRGDGMVDVSHISINGGPLDLCIAEEEIYLSKEGFIPLAATTCYNATFFSANSVQKPKNFQDTEEGNRAQTTYRLGTELPYLFIMTRFAHYIKVLYKMNMGMWRDNKDLLQDELNNWIGQYVSHQDVPFSVVYNGRPIRTVRIVVEDSDDEEYRYRFFLKTSPHMKYMGEYFNLSLVGKLD
jgi:type VI secretion system protein ImpC